jgi:hypothetical protein
MAKATVIKITSIANGIIYAVTNDGIRLQILSDQNGFLDLAARDPRIISPKKAAKIMVGCFKRKSTFYGIQKVNFYIGDMHLEARKSSKVKNIIGFDVDH